MTSTGKGNLKNKSSNPYQVLPYDQICKLKEVLEQNVLLASNLTGEPTITLTIKEFLQQIRKNFEALDIQFKDMRLNGGAASYVISSDHSFSYNDLDLIISLDNTNGTDDMQKIRSVVLNSISRNNRHHLHNPESYIQKQVLVHDSSSGDLWSLISLGSRRKSDRIVELKIVYHMRRKFEFSVDSFQINLDSLLSFLEQGHEMKCHFYPTVVAESVWGSFHEAECHLKKRLIMTLKPEEIRGGGLLKYCKLLIEGYKPHIDLDVVSLERYMCSRFFIDFPDVEKQRHKLISYLNNHFPDDSKIRVNYLRTLECVVSNSTVCLMNHERYQTLSLINNIMYDVWNRTQTPLHIEIFNDPDQWALDNIIYGTCMNPNPGMLSCPTSVIHTPSDHSPIEPTACPAFSDQ